MSKSFQDQGSVTNCFGCGADNVHGNQLKSFWHGDEAIAEFLPKSHHCGGSPEIVYGGLLASLIDCHACNFAIARYYKSEGRAIGTAPKIMCVTAQLNISFLKPTPIGEALMVVARLKSSEDRKTWVTCELSAAGEIRVKGEVLVIRLADKS